MYCAELWCSCDFEFGCKNIANRRYPPKKSDMDFIEMSSFWVEMGRVGNQAGRKCRTTLDISPPLIYRSKSCSPLAVLLQASGSDGVRSLILQEFLGLSCERHNQTGCNWSPQVDETCRKMLDSAKVYIKGWENEYCLCSQYGELAPLSTSTPWDEFG